MDDEKHINESKWDSLGRLPSIRKEEDQEWGTAIFTSCVSLGKSLNFTKCQFYHLKHEDRTHTR